MDYRALEVDSDVLKEIESSFESGVQKNPYNSSYNRLKRGLNKESSKCTKTNGPKPRARRSAPAQSSSSGRVKSSSKGRAKAREAASPYPASEASSSGGEVKVMVPSLGMYFPFCLGL